MRELIKKTKSLTDKPFGVGIVLKFPHKENVKVILEEKVALLQVSWGEYPRELVSEAHGCGVMVVHQVSFLVHVYGRSMLFALFAHFFPFREAYIY